MLLFHHRRHNELAEKAARLFPIRFSRGEDTMPGHAWQASVTYRQQKQNAGFHLASLEPGLVNGIPAAIRMRFGDAPIAARARITAEQTSLKKPKIKDEELVDVFLDEQASVRLTWRRIGTGATPTSVSGDGNAGLSLSFEKVPDFFKRLGVRDASTNPLNYEALIENVRYLAACDLVLTQPRPVIFTQLTAEDVVAGTQVTASPGYILPQDRQPRVVALSKYTPAAEEPISPRDAIYRQFTDPPLDQVHLSTVYALSPPNSSSEAVDGSWQIFVKYNLHWNLAHASRVQTFSPPAPITLFTGLAAGLGDTLFNWILSNNNDWTAALANLLSANRAYGKFIAI